MVLKFVKLSERGRFRDHFLVLDFRLPTSDFRLPTSDFRLLDFFFEHISCATMEYMGRSFDIYSPDGQTILYKVVPWNWRMQSAPFSTPSAIGA